MDISLLIFFAELLLGHVSRAAEAFRTVCLDAEEGALDRRRFVRNDSVDVAQLAFGEPGWLRVIDDLNAKKTDRKRISSGCGDVDLALP